MLEELVWLGVGLGVVECLILMLAVYRRKRHEHRDSGKDRAVRAPEGTGASPGGAGAGSYISPNIVSAFVPNDVSGVTSFIFSIEDAVSPSGGEGAKGKLLLSGQVLAKLREGAEALSGRESAPPADIPSVEGSVVGYRSWEVSSDGELRSLRGRPSFVAGVPAKCLAGGHHSAPDFGCGCGYYLLKERKGAIIGGNEGISFVVAKAEGWGLVVEHEAGYRCEYVRPLAFYVSAEQAFFEGEELAKIARDYRCQIFDYYGRLVPLKDDGTLPG